MKKSRTRKYLGMMPQVATTVLHGKYRHDVLELLAKQHSAVGIELGVAEGIFSERIMNSQRFKIFYGVDAYADMHDTAQYKRALKRVGIESNYRLLRMRFDEAYDLFEDNYFDFIYVDGYAHSGEDGGQTIFNWYKKLAVGGVIAGDDYHHDWPLVMWGVNELAKQTGSVLHLTELVEPNIPYCQYPSWAIVKTASPDSFSCPATLIASGRRENARRLRKYRLSLIFEKPLKKFMRKLLREAEGQPR
jgi:hypothetical protein